jgi:hypothetical protein
MNSPKTLSSSINLCVNREIDYFRIKFILKAIEISKKIVHKKIILLITDGLDNNSRTTPEYIKNRLNNLNVNLIAIGYTFNHEIIHDLRDLVYNSNNQEGLYVDIDASENLDYVFLNMVENNAGPILQVETFT